jgi:hypothetical protein
MRATERKAQERRRALIISGAMVLLAAGAAIATLVETSSHVDQPTTATVSDKFRAATITSDFDGSGCSQQVFDNRTGRVAASTQSCAATSYYGNGMPSPTGTIHRLDAISKSFRGHQSVD